MKSAITRSTEESKNGTLLLCPLAGTIPSSPSHAMSIIRFRQFLEFI